MPGPSSPLTLPLNDLISLEMKRQLVSCIVLKYSIHTNHISQMGQAQRLSLLRPQYTSRRSRSQWQHTKHRTSVLTKKANNHIYDNWVRFWASSAELIFWYPICKTCQYISFHILISHPSSATTAGTSPNIKWAKVKYTSLPIHHRADT